MNIALVGAGNIAWHLAMALKNTDSPVKEIYNRNRSSAEELAKEAKAKVVLDLKSFSTEIDIIILAVSDEAINEVSAKLNVKPGQIVIHTSGSTEITILKSYFNDYGVLYPLQTFSKAILIDFKNIPVCVEGSTLEVSHKLELVAKLMSNNVLFVNSAQRLALHIAAVFACNFTNHFYSIAAEILSDNDLNFDLIKPLIKETAEKALIISPKEAQTGPAKRNDQITLKKHIKILEKYADWMILYQKISQDIVKISVKNQASHK